MQYSLHKSQTPVRIAFRTKLSPMREHNVEIALHTPTPNTVYNHHHVRHMASIICTPRNLCDCWRKEATFTTTQQPTGWRRARDHHPSWWVVCLCCGAIVINVRMRMRVEHRGHAARLKTLVRCPPATARASGNTGDCNEIINRGESCARCAKIEPARWDNIAAAAESDA